jgi:carbon starvation protein
MRQIIFNDRVDAALVGIFLLVVLSLLVFTIRTCIAARRMDAPTAREIPASLVPAE